MDSISSSLDVAYAISEVFQFVANMEQHRDLFDNGPLQGLSNEKAQGNIDDLKKDLQAKEKFVAN
ncbi:unnamed protein product [Ilex paraguariensis]|uniref:Uncharacterized protein n=1 Tax=Ilex paraguariensis TaxID=185542 RepID=A0ABC8UJE1_9AQUA